MRLVLPNLSQIEGLSHTLANTLQRMVASIQTGWNKQHQGDGSHTDVTAHTATVAGLSVFNGKLRLGAHAHWFDPATTDTYHDITTPTNAPTLPSWAGYSTLSIADVSWLRIYPRVSLGADLNITGIDATGRQQGDLLLVTNYAHGADTGSDIIFHEENVSSTEGNRFFLGNGNYTLERGRGVWMVYDSVYVNPQGTPRPRWRIIGP